MSLFDKYKLYIYDDLPEGEQKKVASEIFYILMATVMNNKKIFENTSSEYPF